MNGGKIFKIGNWGSKVSAQTMKSNGNWKKIIRWMHSQKIWFGKNQSDLKKILLEDDV